MARPKSNLELEATNLTLPKLVKKEAMKVAFENEESLSEYVARLLEKDLKRVGRWPVTPHVMVKKVEPLIKTLRAPLTLKQKERAAKQLALIDQVERAAS